MRVAFQLLDEEEANLRRAVTLLCLTGLALALACGDPPTAPGPAEQTRAGALAAVGEQSELRGFGGVAQAALEDEEAAGARPGAPGRIRPGEDPEEPAAMADVARAYASAAALAPERTDWSGGNAARGQGLYNGHCAVCHGGGGSGEGLAAVALNPKPRDFRDGTFYIDANANNETGEDVDLARVILEGPAAFGGSDAMQGWQGALSTTEVRDLVAYIRSLERGSG